MQDSFIKWPGNKSTLAVDIISKFPNSYNTYYEPFLGSGAVLLKLQPTNAIINDINTKLINCYYGIKSNVNKVMDILDGYNNDKSSFLMNKDLYNSDNYSTLSIEEKSALLIYLTKTCYKGLYRENYNGEFNQSYGNYKRQCYYKCETLITLSQYLNANKVHIYNDYYQNVLKLCHCNDLVYLDPPYYNDSNQKIRKYTSNDFDINNHIQLKEIFDSLNERKCYCVQSSYDIPFIKNLYTNYNIIKLPTYTRKLDQEKVDEILITNY